MEKGLAALSQKPQPCLGLRPQSAAPQPLRLSDFAQGMSDLLRNFSMLAGLFGRSAYLRYFSDMFSGV